MVQTTVSKPKFAEFFSGGGMVHAALGAQWDCVLANDIDPMKCETYRQNWGGAHLLEGDVAELPEGTLHQPLDLIWASSPCQDFSLAGKGRGLKGLRSGVFYHWMRLLSQGVKAGFVPSIIAFENVTGLMSRAGGQDFTYVLNSLAALGYRVGALEIDARHFVPQSRPRLFVIALRKDIAGEDLMLAAPTGLFHTDKLRRYVNAANADLKTDFTWWAHQPPTLSTTSIADVVDRKPDTSWQSEAKVDVLLDMMSEPSAARIAHARRTGKREIGLLYKRGRPDENGKIRQRAEVRFDGIAGCLRTPAGGSSRQTILFVKGNSVKARLLSSKEASRLMGLPESYRMPTHYNSAYKVAGDGVVVPIVSYLDEMLFQPMLRKARAKVPA
ncbi:MAG: DNA cytosine methyltransferase [Planktotalea sp.]|uniref:DNA cytosine methyltransferase n=1 Tax=Planktotalea sp. TaxID=2029877 RepID=UPI0026042951|nr:DNA cytosine methyltransferase [Planktotalea sp.]MDG1078144.1 DNA cytosine methyltransferase [Planktotalea sp.]MDG1082799.1 DNA cytosine methyltransferase [Planktotalea sp.]